MSSRNGNGMVTKTANAFASASAPVRDKFLDMVHNLSSARERFFKQFFFDDRRDIYNECGWPKNITIEQYKNMYARSGVAARVVDIFPSECWQAPPHIYEDEKPDRTTVFEKALEDLDKDLSGSSWHKAVEGENSSLFEILERGDELSGIGSFGVLLLGFDDDKDLSEPVEGIDEFGRATNLKEDVETQYVDEDGNVVSKEQLEKKELEEKEEKKKKKLKEKQATDEVKAELFKEQQETQAKLLEEQGLKDEAKAAKTEAQLKEKQAKTVKKLEDTRLKPTSTNNEVPSYNVLSEELSQLYSMGTDAQYTDPIPQTDRGQAPKKEGEGLRLLYIKPFDESLVQILEYESNSSNPRYGLPKRYRITLNDPEHSATHGGVGLDTTAPDVHWTRVIHLADSKESSDTFATPRMQVVFNNLLNHQKVSGGSAEMYWKAAFMGISLETHPNMGGDVDVPVDDLKDQMEQYMNGLQRYFWSAGMSAKSLAPQVSDPTPQLNNQIQEICIKLGCPKRIFEGSERGELASSQDSKAWDGRVLARCKNYLSARIIAPFIDRLIATGVLPQPAHYTIDWPDKESLSEEENAEIGKKKIEALSQYVKGEVESVLSPEDMYTEFLGFTDDKAKAFMEHVEEAEPLDVTPPMPMGMGPPQAPGMAPNGPDGQNPTPGAEGRQNGPQPPQFQGNLDILDAMEQVARDTINSRRFSDEVASKIIEVVANNCGTGAGGFKPGNTCARGGGGFGAFSEDYQDLMGRVRDPDGGFTYQPATGKEPSSGYALSIYPERSFATSADDMSADDLIDYVGSNSDVLADNSNYLGGWHDPESGKVFFDVSRVVSDSGEAHRLALENDQIAYFDLSTFESVDVNREATSGGVANNQEYNYGQETKPHFGGPQRREQSDFSVRENEGPAGNRGGKGEVSQGGGKQPTMNIIRKLKSGKYRLYSKSGKNLGTFDSRAAAQKHEREVEYFKRQDNSSGEDKEGGEPADGRFFSQVTDNNCGTGAGGFKPGNTCAKGGGGGPSIQGKSPKEWYVEDELPEGWYVHGRSGRQDLDTGHAIQLTRDWHTADRYANVESGGSMWMVSPKSDAKVLDATDPSQTRKVVKQFKADSREGLLSPALDDVLMLDPSDEQLMDEMNPTDIVSSAGAWDNPGFASWAAHRMEYDFAKTYDGAVVLSSQIRKHKVDITPEENRLFNLGFGMDEIREMQSNALNDKAVDKSVEWLGEGSIDVTDNNCGTGAGGFKPGNTCARGGGSFHIPTSEEGRRTRIGEIQSQVDELEMTPHRMLNVMGEDESANERMVNDAIKSSTSMVGERRLKAEIEGVVNGQYALRKDEYRDAMQERLDNIKGFEDNYQSFIREQYDQGNLTVPTDKGDAVIIPRPNTLRRYRTQSDLESTGLWKNKFDKQNDDYYKMLETDGKLELNAKSAYYGEPATLTDTGAKLPATNADILPDSIQYGSRGEPLPKAERMLANSRVYMQTKEDALEGIANSGRIENMFHGHTGIGASDYYRDQRAGVESRLFGLSEDAPADARPVYGYLQNSGRSITTGKHYNMYGDVQIELKPEVRRRSTYTWDDSFDSSTRAGSFSRINYPTEHFGGDALDARSYITSNYVEAQVHGGLDLGDMASVRLPNDHSIPEASLSKLRGAGVNIIELPPEYKE